jgi:hypothetical protein
VCKDEADIVIGHFELPLTREQVVAYAPKMAEHYGWNTWSAQAIGTVLVVTKEDEQCLVN